MIFGLNSLRYEDVRQNIVDYLKERGQYVAEFDYQGSNLAYIIDSMAYATMLMSYQVSMAANNIFLDTTEIRKNAVSISKTLGYRPKRKIASRLVGKFRYSGENFLPTTQIIIPVKTYFKGTNNGHIFVNTEPIILTYKNPVELEGEFVLFQGEFRRFDTFGTGQSLQSFNVPSTDVDENHLRVYVKPTNESDDALAEWNHVKTFFEITEDNIFFVEEDVVNERNPKILFGNGIIGRIPSLSESVIVEYLETKGVGGDGESEITLPANLKVTQTLDIPSVDFDKIDILIPDNTFSYGGSDNESLESIKTNAPKYFSAAGRGVTGGDFKTVLSNYKNIKSFNIIGGDELFPGDIKRLGTSFITAVPFLADDFFMNENLYMGELEEVDILGELRHIGIIATKKSFIKPTYIVAELMPSIEIAALTSQEDANKIFDNVALSLNTYFNKNLSTLAPRFRESKLRSSMDMLPAVMSSNLQSNFYFVLSGESFYKDKVTYMYLPTVKVKDVEGNTVYDDNDLPLRSNYIKQNYTIIAEENLKEGVDYDIYSLPPKLSALYGTIYHPNINRLFYNRDVLNVEVYRISIIEVNGLPTINYIGKEFYDKDNNHYAPTLVDTGIANQWNIMFNDIPVGALVKNIDNTFQVVSVDVNFLDGIGAIPTFNIGLVTETNNFGEDVTHTSITIDLASSISDLRLQGETNLIKVKYVIEESTFVISDIKEFIDPLTNETTTFDISQTDDVTANIMYLGEVMWTFTYDPITTNFIITNENQKLLNMLGLRKEVEIRKENIILDSGLVTEEKEDVVYGIDIFNEVSIGTFNYFTGEAIYKKVIEGNTSNTTKIEETIIKVFDNYNSENRMDNIRMVTDNLFNESNILVGHLTDFDGRFNQYLVPLIYPPTVKRV